MEYTRYTPPVEQEDSQNTGIEEPQQQGELLDYALSQRELNDLQWRQDKERQEAWNLCHAHGVYVGGVYYHHGCAQPKRQ